MGKISFDSSNAIIGNVTSLNQEPEIFTLGLEFPENKNVISVNGSGNISNYLVILSKVRAQLQSGEFQVSVTKSHGEILDITISSRRVTENNKDITSLM